MTPRVPRRPLEALGITATHLRDAGIVDEVVPEPPGGAHTDHEAVFRALDEVLSRQLEDLSSVAPAELVEARYAKFRGMGQLGQGLHRRRCLIGGTRSREESQR